MEKIYESPLVKVVEVKVEKGFAASGAANDFAGSGEAGNLIMGDEYYF